MGIGAGFAFEAESVFEVEGDHGLLGVLQHEITQCADGDLRGDGFALGFAELRMTRVDFFFCRGDELVEQVVGLHAETSAATDFDVGAGFIFIAERVAEFGGAARGERDHLVGKMSVVVGGGVVTESAQGFYDGALRFGLAGVDYVVDLGDIAEVGMIFLGGFVVGCGGDPALVVVRIPVELAVGKIATQQSELPHVVGDVFTDVADRAIGAHDYFLVFFGDLVGGLSVKGRICPDVREHGIEVVCFGGGFDGRIARAHTGGAGAAHDPAAFIFSFGLEGEDTGFF